MARADLQKIPPSAIAVFSALIVSSPNALQHVAAPPFSTAHEAAAEPSHTGLHCLPTEIIQMIFHFVFESCVSPRDGSVHGENSASWLDGDPLSPFLFPYALACVCLRWFRILTGVPIYWTRQVIALDTIAPSLNATRTTLQWAGNRLLKIIVTRHRGSSESHFSECASVGHVMKLLHPHITHIWSLSFDVEHSSSIPALWRESGCARHLKVLTLISRSDVSNTFHALTWRGSGHEYDGKLKVPLLQQVTLGSHFVKNPLMAHPRLASWFRRITSLTISGDGASGGDTMSLRRFLSVADSLLWVRELTIEDVHFDDDAPYPSLHVLRPAVLCLRRVTGRTALRDMLTPVGVVTRPREAITIVDCAIHGFRAPGSDSDPTPQFSSAQLTVTSTDSHSRIEGVVCRWNGEQLSVVNCVGVLRGLLEQLHGETAPTSLSRLFIVDCERFRAGDVISLVKSRASQAASVALMGCSEEEEGFAALAELRVRGRGPPVSDERAAWLAGHVPAFSWDTVTKDGARYVWDGSAAQLRVSGASACGASKDVCAGEA